MDRAADVAFIGLGANLGDRADSLRRAVRALGAAEGIRVVKVSPVYESEAHTLAPGEQQPPYLNAVVQVRTHRTPEALLDVCRDLERAAGRRRRRRWAPRRLDLDLLLVDEVTCATDRLTLPHPRLAERRFVLQPLHDLAPDLHVPPPFDASVDDLLYATPDLKTLHRTGHVIWSRGDA